MLDGPAVGISDPRELLLGYLDWYRDALMRKLDGLTDEQLRRPVDPLEWSPLGLVKHLMWVERRWMRWGFTAEDIVAYPPGEDDRVEFVVMDDESTDSVLLAYRDEVERTQAVLAEAALGDKAALGGRFPTRAQAPSLARILFHLLQEYARHVGQLDVARELIDGVTGE